METNETVIYKMVSNIGHEIAVCVNPDQDRVYIRTKIDFGQHVDYEREGMFPLSANGIAQALARAAYIVTTWTQMNHDEFSEMIDAAADGQEA